MEVAGAGSVSELQRAIYGSGGAANADPGASGSATGQSGTDAGAGAAAAAAAGTGVGPAAAEAAAAAGAADEGGEAAAGGMVEGVQADQEVLVWLLRINLEEPADDGAPADVLLPADGDDAVSKMTEQVTQLLLCVMPTEKAQAWRR